MPCRDQPITCRKKIAGKFGLEPHKSKSWQFGGICPKCGHGGFSITAGEQGHFPLRHIWHCNCHRCRCDPFDIRVAMLAAGVSGDCLGNYARKQPAGRGDPGTAAIRGQIEAVLSDPEVHAPADLRIMVTPDHLG
jgi:hypothetical protein